MNGETIIRIEHHPGEKAMPWSYMVRGDGQTYGGRCWTRDQAHACADSALRGLFRMRHAREESQRTGRRVWPWS